MERDEAHDLRQFGYGQVLVRQLGGFSSLALAFSLISVFTGVFANFGQGLRQVGGAVVWSWLIVLVGQALVALVLAELSTRMPLSGYGYQWTSRLVNHHLGFFVGWLLTLQLLTGFPGICATLATEVGSLIGGEATQPAVRTALTLAIIATVAVIHLAGIRLASLINDVGVWTELVGVATIGCLLIGLALVRHADVTTLGETGWRIVLAVGGVAIFACALASMAGASRLLFAWAWSPRSRCHHCRSWASPRSICRRSRLRSGWRSARPCTSAAFGLGSLPGSRARPPGPP